MIPLVEFLPESESTEVYDEWIRLLSWEDIDICNAAGIALS